MADPLNEFSFFQGQYRFTDPVRYFTSTDPYYWEVDNIPLKQLQENDLWLKDQIEQGFKNFRVSFGRDDFLELKPYAEGTNNVIKVLPGRYTARINDASTNERLQVISRLLGDVFDEPNKWRIATYASEELATNIDKITSEVASDALFMNGLMERVFTWGVKSPYEAWADVNSVPGIWDTVYGPIAKLFVWPGSDYTNTDGWPQDESQLRPDRGLRRMSGVESFLTKYWRGVFRLSVVDVAEELSIDIPSFNQRDFDYYDEDNVLRQNNNATVRIDLLFVYSKAVDSGPTKIRGNSLDSYRTITKPELGLVRGAGVILRKNLPSAGTVSNSDATFDDNGNLEILASPADSKGTEGGFDSLDVRGSFPSPDDLMNIAPLILDNLEASDPRLIGQTVLPIAYVVVNKEGTTNTFGESVVSDEDIIDIRPFFRTAELSYNERAGIAAAVPQLSIANPVVTDAKLKNHTFEIIKDYDAKINALETELRGEFVLGARVVGGGLIQGGSLWGPEGVIRNYYARQSNNTLNPTQTFEMYIDKYDTTTGAVNYRPDWDAAPWVPETDRKLYPNDCVFLAYHLGGTTPKLGYIPNNFAGGRLEDLATPNSLIFFCKKTIRLNKSRVNWMKSYMVNVSLENCVPIGNTPYIDRVENNPSDPFNSFFASRYGAAEGTTFAKFGGAAHTWVEYQKDQFTIYCAWNGMQSLSNANPAGTSNTINYFETIQRSGLSELRDDSKVTAGFHVLVEELLEPMTSGSNLINGGLCIYPTVKFNIIGFPDTYGGFRNMNSENVTLTLV